MIDARAMVGVRVRHSILNAEGVVQAVSFHDVPDEYGPPPGPPGQSYHPPTPLPASLQPWVFVLLVVVDLVNEEGPDEGELLMVGDLDQWVARDCVVSQRFGTLVPMGPAQADGDVMP